MNVKTFSIIDKDLYLDKTFKNNFLLFCKQASLETSEPAHANMWTENWINDWNTLPYHVYVSGRFKDNGDIFVTTIEDNIEAVSGVYISEFDPMVAIGGVRSWVNSKFRGKFIVGRHILPQQLKWARNKNCKTVALTFNEYNKRLIPYFKRTGFGIKKERNPDSLFYTGLHEVPFPVRIQNTRQWIIYNKIDPDYDPDWKSIAWE